MRVLSKHNNKYYKIRNFSIRTLSKTVVSRGFRAIQQPIAAILHTRKFLLFLLAFMSFVSLVSLPLWKKKKNPHQIVFSSSFLYFPFIYFFISFNWYLIYWRCSYMINSLQFVFQNALFIEDALICKGKINSLHYRVVFFFFFFWDSLEWVIT